MRQERSNENEAPDIPDSDSTNVALSLRNEKRMATTEMRMVRWAMEVSLLGQRRDEEILEEARVEPIPVVMRRRRWEWFGHVK